MFIFYKFLFEMPREALFIMLCYVMLSLYCVVQGYEMQLFKVDIGDLAKYYGLCLNGYNKL